MRKWTLLLSLLSMVWLLAGCSSAETNKDEAGLTITEPTFILFYTDN